MGHISRQERTDVRTALSGAAAVVIVVIPLLLILLNLSLRQVGRSPFMQTRLQ